MKTKSSRGTAISARGDWKKKVYQLRRNCA